MPKSNETLVYFVELLDLYCAWINTGFDWFKHPIFINKVICYINNNNKIIYHSHPRSRLCCLLPCFLKNCQVTVVHYSTFSTILSQSETLETGWSLSSIAGLSNGLLKRRYIILPPRQMALFSQPECIQFIVTALEAFTNL